MRERPTISPGGASFGPSICTGPGPLRPAGELVLGGAYADPVDGALLIFQGKDARVAEQFAESDPYVRHGLVARWWVRPWTTVVGDLAETPVRPGGS